VADAREARIAFKSAAKFFVDTVAQVPAGKWNAAGLGEWTVRELVAHTSRAFTTLEDGIAKPGSEVSLLSTAAYFRASLSGEGVNAEIAERGRQASAGLGDDPAAYVSALADRVTSASDQAPDDLIVTIRYGTIRLADYLPARTFELTVQTLDLAKAIGSKTTPPLIAMRATLDILRDIAVEQRRAGDVIFALTGRGELPKGFSLLG
jgi:uncharacterized protein (TIGR03083 family)